MRKLILYIIESLGASADVEVLRGEITTFVIRVKPEDKPLVWGENGKVFQSIKTIVGAIAHKPVKLKLEV